MWYNNYLLLDMSKNRNRKQLAKFENNIVFINTFMRLFETALQRYRLENLPETINERVVLQSFICYGNATFFNNNGNVLSLPSVPSGNGYNINGDPVSAWVFSRNGLFNKEIKLHVEGGQIDPLLKKGTSGTLVTDEKGVMVWETRTRYPFLNTIIYYARAISDTLRTIDVARKWLKVPFIPVCEESLVQSVATMMKDIADNNDVIPVSTGVQDISKFNILPIQQSPESIQTASELIDWYEQQYRSACGMRANTNVDKKGENLIADEIHANDSYTDSVSDTLVEYLQKQFDFVNEVFGTSIKVVENENLQSETAVKESEVKDNGTDATDI